VNQGFMPDDFTCEDYLDRVKDFNVIGGAIVSGSFQGFDQSYLINALQTLGEHFVGVPQLPDDTSDEEIMRLHQLGVRAIRFNVKRGVLKDLSRLDYMARRVYELVGWHSELYIDSASLVHFTKIVENLPAVSIDHLGLTKEGFYTLLALVGKGVRVKATGFGRVELNVEEALRKIFSVNPDALMFGTDLPSTRAKRPFQTSDMELIYDVLGDEGAKKVFYKNAINWYKI
jgi:predicted TIM-barrel fold metal-dependent hydrolase